jgi:hypothetical protein
VVKPVFYKILIFFCFKKYFWVNEHIKIQSKLPETHLNLLISALTIHGMERNSSLFPIDLPSINSSVLWRLNAKKHWVRGNYHWVGGNYHWVGGNYHWVGGPLLNLKESCETIFVPPLWIVLSPWKRTKWKKVRLVQPLNGVSATASEVNITYYLIFLTIKLCLVILLWIRMHQNCFCQECLFLMF